ncbi:GntR family transcriptional regulator [Alicyclobacillus ferrooxydans]|uniref:GntR family transcriptional regulator n=1 Tax=Alicyclobacillus ferrooxydans TaxID=471514 RepID=UPI0006D5B062|nr:GntR family transcriptional regulator [Alicyclobacillus ferrooxydans]
MGISGTEFRYRTLSEGVESIVRKMILLGDLVPGERINEVQLAEQLEMSRGPVREALRRLQAEGLVTYHAHRGTFVAELSDKDAEEVYKLRALLEVGAVKAALPNFREKHLGHLREIVSRFEAACLNEDISAMIQADLDFHHLIVQLSGNGRLVDMYQSLDTQLGAMFIAVQTKAPDRLANVAKLHFDLVTALESRDEDIICSAFEDHYLSAWQALDRLSP